MSRTAISAAPSGLQGSATRYGTLAIALHWATVLLILGLFATGLVSDATPGGAGKAALLVFHVPLGAGVLVLTLLRIVWALWGDRRPVPVAGQPLWQRRLAKITHLSLYAALLLLAASGLATTILSGAVPAIFAGAPAPDFSELVPRAVHGLLSKLMLALLALHVGAALYHQFLRRDHLLARMGVPGA